MRPNLIGAFGKRIRKVKNLRRKVAVGAGGTTLGFGAYYGHKRGKRKAFRRGFNTGVQSGVIAGVQAGLRKKKGKALRYSAKIHYNNPY